MEGIGQGLWTTRHEMLVQERRSSGRLTWNAMERRSRQLREPKRGVTIIFLLPMKMGGWALCICIIGTTDSEKYVGLLHSEKEKVLA